MSTIEFKIIMGIQYPVSGYIQWYNVTETIIVPTYK